MLPCTGVDCGRHGHCAGGSCQCEAHFSGAHCEVRILSDLAFEYVGCFRDNEGGRDLIGVIEPLDGSTPLENANSCLALCAGFSYFGLQWVNQCSCANSYNNGFGTNGDQADCPGGECPMTDCDADNAIDADGTADLCGNGQGDCGNRNAIYCIGAC